MSSQREFSLDDLAVELRGLKERIRGILPSYTASLKDLSQLPEEFERRLWTSRVETQIGQLKANFYQYRARAQEAGLYGKLMILAADVVLKAGGIEPIPLPDSLQAGISIHPSGKIEPSLVDDPNKTPDTIFVTFEEFDAIIQKFKDSLLNGTIVPTDEDEIPRLIYSSALEQASSSAYD